MARTSSLNCLSCRNPYQTSDSLNCLPPFHWKPLFFTEKCFVASPSPKSWLWLFAPEWVMDCNTFVVYGTCRCFWIITFCSLTWTCSCAPSCTSIAIARVNQPQSRTTWKSRNPEKNWWKQIWHWTEPWPPTFWLFLAFLPSSTAKVANIFLRLSRVGCMFSLLCFPLDLHISFETWQKVYPFMHALPRITKQRQHFLADFSNFLDFLIFLVCSWSLLVVAIAMLGCGKNSCDPKVTLGASHPQGDCFCSHQSRVIIEAFADIWISWDVRERKHCLTCRSNGWGDRPTKSQHNLPPLLPALRVGSCNAQSQQTQVRIPICSPSNNPKNNTHPTSHYLIMVGPVCLHLLLNFLCKAKQGTQEQAQWQTISHMGKTRQSNGQPTLTGQDTQKSKRMIKTCKILHFAEKWPFFLKSWMERPTWRWLMCMSWNCCWKNFDVFLKLLRRSTQEVIHIGEDDHCNV